MSTGSDSEHSEYAALAVGWTLHSLEPDDEERFAAHLPTCARCRRTVSEVTATLGEIAYVVPDEEPPPVLRERLLAAAAETPQEVGTPPVERVPVMGSEERRPLATGAGPGPLSRRNWLILAAAALVLVLAVGMGVWNVALRNDRSQGNELAQRYQRAVAALTQPGAQRAALDTPNGKQVATLVERKGQATIVSMAMPVNNAKKTTYVLWGLQSSTTAPVALGTFDIAHSGVDVRSVATKVQKLGYPTYALSREPGRSAPAKPSSVMASGAVST